MKSEELVELLNGIGSDLVENAGSVAELYESSREGVSFRAEYSRKRVWKTVIAFAAVTAAAVFGVFFLTRNVGKNGLVLEPVSPYASSVQSGSTESTPPADSDPTELAFKDEMKFKTVDAVDDRLTYKWEVEPDRISFEKTGFIGYEYEIDDSATALRYLEEFFGNGNFFVDKKYRDNWERWVYSGGFLCEVESGTVAYSPVGGKVITAAARGSQGHSRMGNSIAVEMPEGKIFVIFHLDEIYVDVGDTVTEGQALGLCGSSGGVMVGKTKLGLVIMKKTGYLSKGELRQTFTEDFDGLVLTVTTDKTEYNIGDTIHLTATLENNRDEDVNLYYGMATAGNSIELSPRFDDLIEYPCDDISRDAVITVITVTPRLEYEHHFDFVTYTDYIEGVTETGGIERIPDLNKPAAPGVHYGKLRILICPDKNKYDNIIEHTLDFSVTVTSPNSNSDTESEPTEKVTGIYGETEIPDIPCGDKDCEGKANVMEQSGALLQSLDSMVFETHDIGDHTVKLIGDRVRTDEINFPGSIYAQKLRAEVWKNGTKLEDIAYNDTLLYQSQFHTEYRLFADKLGSYLDVYKLDCPVIAMRYFFDDDPARTVTKAVEFAVIQNDRLCGGFVGASAAGTGVTMNPDMDWSDHRTILATNTSDGERCRLSVFAADEFTIVDGKTLTDEKAGIRYTFDFSDPLPFELYTAEKIGS